MKKAHAPTFVQYIKYINKISVNYVSLKNHQSAQKNTDETQPKLGAVESHSLKVGTHL